MQQGEGDDAAELKETPAGLRPLEGAQGGRGHRLALALGRRAARAGTSSARRWPRRCWALDFEIHGGGSDLVFPHHENEIAQTEAARGQPLARIWMHNGMVRDGRREDGQVGRQHPAAARGARASSGARRSSCTSSAAHYRQPLAFSDGGARGRRERRRSRCASWCDGWTPTRPAGPELDALVERFFDHLADDFNTPAARAELFDWVAEANRRLDAGERVGPGPARRDAARARAREPAVEPAEEAPGGGRAAGWPSARRRAPRATSSARTALRDELARRGWEIRDTAEGPRLVPDVIVYGRNPVREALRGRRRVHRVYATERGAREVWLGGVDVDIAEPYEIEERCGSPDHQGVCAEVQAYPYADAGSLLEPDDALVVCLDEVQDPHNLGAVCRVAEAAGARAWSCPSAVRPRSRRRSARHRRARSSTSRSRACATSPTGSRRPSRARRGCTAPRPTRAFRTTAPTTAGAWCWCSARRGSGLRPRVADACDELVSLPSSGKVGSLNVSTAAAALVYGILQFRTQGLDKGP